MLNNGIQPRGRKKMAIGTGGTGTTWTYEAAEISGTGITIASSPFTTSGPATLANGTVTINNPCILGTRPISLSENTAGTPNALGYTQSSGSLTVNSASASDNSPISWTQN